MNNPNSVILANAITRKTLSLFLAVCIFITVSVATSAQNATIDYTINTAQPNGVFYVCGNAQQNTLHITNNNAFTMTSISFTLHLPVGGTYVLGSINNATELNISDLNNPQFTTTFLASLNSRDISYSLNFNCPVIAFQNAGGITKDIVDINYNGGITQTGLLPTASYNVAAASLNILNVTNSIYNGSLGSSYTQSITIRNGGLGCISNGFLKLDNAGGSFSFSNASIGTLLNDTIFFNTLNMPGGDGLWCNDEDIVVTYSTTINNCNTIYRNITAGWGCGGVLCQISQAYQVGVTLTNGVPNLTATFTYPDGSYYCNNANFNVNIKVKNNGTGAATNIATWLGTGNISQNNQNWFIANEWEYSTNNGVNWNAVTASTTIVNTQPYVPVNSLGGFKASFSNVVLNAGDSILVRGIFHTAQFTDSTQCSAGGVYWGGLNMH